MKIFIADLFTNPQINGLFTIIGGLASLGVILWSIIKFFDIRIWKGRFDWDASLKTARLLLNKIEKSNWQPEIVLGIGRSGGIWGGWLAGNLGSLPFYVLDKSYKEIANEVEVYFPDLDSMLGLIRNRYPDKKRILVVEGATSTGLTPKKLKTLLESGNIDLEFKFGTLFCNPSCRVKIEYVGKIGPEKWPNRFAWHERPTYKTWLRDVFERK